MEAVIILTLVEATEFIDTFVKQILALNMFFKEAVEQD